MHDNLEEITLSRTLGLVDITMIGVGAMGWIAGGMLLYWGYFRGKEEMERPKEVLHEEALASVNYSVLVPAAIVEEAAQLGRLGSLLAKDHGGEVLALNVVTVPPSLKLSDGRLFLCCAKRCWHPFAIRQSCRSKWG